MNVTAQRGDTSTCECGEALLWVGTKNGKMQPVNATPDPAGIVVLLDPPTFTPTPRGPLRSSRVLTKDEREGSGLFSEVEGDRYMPHHATCTKVEKFRKPKAS